jgi:hypothetical protein
MQTVAEFAEACKHLEHEEIYELFEDDISQELRDMIYAYSEANCNEPCRNALNRIGRIFSVQTLAEY